jgi:hypothetical protein
MKKKRLTEKQIVNMKLAHLQEEIEKLKITIQRLEIGLELNGLEIHHKGLNNG